jgi:hypothetical protein
VPELWRYGKQGLQISVLQDGKYVESDASPTFPNLPIVELIDRYVQQSQIVDSSQAIRSFKQWVQDNL